MEATNISTIKLKIEQVMAPAIRLAEDGFPIGQILAGFIVSAGAKMKPFHTLSPL